MTISNTMDTYLETIYILSEEKPFVRTTDISNYLNISKPSVNRAINTLKENGYVTHENYGDIFLTDAGRKIGYEVFKRHHIIKKFLVCVLHIPMEQADKEAISIEHGIGDNTVYKMSQYLKCS
ncbi:MAG: metal-dependent transcriptional regulator [Clostridia bacterium]|nr:metal-dependent transcriptional regulator [Clostridia bacterium]